MIRFSLYKNKVQRKYKNKLIKVQRKRWKSWKKK